MRHYIKAKLKPSAGIALVVLGALALVVGRAFGLNQSNAALAISLALIVGGIILHVALLKHSNRY